MTDFIGIDGEAFTYYKGTPKQSHCYVLLAAADSDGHKKWTFDPKGLSTVRCFEFLLGLPKGYTKVGFGWNYDVNMMLGDLDNESLVKLWKLGSVVYKGYRIDWIPSKMFRVKSNSRSVTIYDVFGFYQSSFVKALEAWGFGPQESIEAMKMQRDSFDSQMKQTVIDYCLEECQQLARLCADLASALSAVQLTVSSWIGAGAIAASLLAKEGVEDHHELDECFPDGTHTPIRSAYFGGRVELFQQGIYHQLWDYDISSAYPSEAIKLPSLTNGKWQRRGSYNPAHPYAIWLCRWSIAESEPVMPFPFRKSGQIYYPREGEGWYHAVEVTAAMTLVEGIEIVEGWEFNPASDDKPFEFIPRVYNERVKLKAEKHAGEKVLKLGLNSLYGKLAQGVGYKGDAPKFQSFFWAGMITAGCRARVLELASLDKHSLVMVATDGVFFSKPVNDAPVRDGLGGLELTILDDVFIAQPGIYQYNTKHARPSGMWKGEPKAGRSRGFFTREINFAALREGYRQHGPNYIGHFHSERFTGLGTLMITGKKNVWRTWVESERKLSLYPSRKFLEPHSFYGGTVRHYPADRVSDELSEPYIPKKSQGDMSNMELEGYLMKITGEEQPLKEY